jgi:hypothetical protein
MPKPYPTHWPWRLLEGVIHALDRIGVSTLYARASAWHKGNYRPLTDDEIALARPIFGDTIDYGRVRLDERAVIVCRSRRCAYVSFNIINTWDALPPATLIHELVHVWQYQQLGAAYIPRALWAQRTAEGYNYGGPAALRAAVDEGRSLLDFNYEQQGDIVADYFRLLRGETPLWSPPDPALQPVFRAVLQKHLPV